MAESSDSNLSNVDSIDDWTEKIVYGSSRFAYKGAGKATERSSLLWKTSQAQFDEDGVLFHIGTTGGRYVNPHEAGGVVASVSSGGGELGFVDQRKLCVHKCNSTDEGVGQWMQVDLSSVRHRIKRRCCGPIPRVVQ